jgi:hypothetical protein
LKAGTPEQVAQMFQLLARDVDNLIEGAIELSYFMRGAIPYEMMLMRTPGERQRINDFISRRIKDESKKMNPVY